MNIQELTTWNAISRDSRQARAGIFLGHAQRRGRSQYMPLLGGANARAAAGSRTDRGRRRRVRAVADFGEPPKIYGPLRAADARHDFVRIDRRDVVTLDLAERGIAAALGAGALAAVANASRVRERGDGRLGIRTLRRALVIGLVVALVVAAARKARAGKRYTDKRRSADSAAAAGVAPMGPSSSNCPPGSDCNASGDGGAGGCGSSSGCSGGGGCGGS